MPPLSNNCFSRAKGSKPLPSFLPTTFQSCAQKIPSLLPHAQKAPHHFSSIPTRPPVFDAPDPVLNQGGFGLQQENLVPFHALVLALAPDAQTKLRFEKAALLHNPPKIGPRGSRPTQQLGRLPAV